MSKRLELTGKQFDKLIVIEFDHVDKHRQSHWKCECECGNEKIISGNSLTQGNTKSCGCLAKFPEGIAARNVILARHKRSAKDRNLKQELTGEQIIAFYKQNCHYCGEPPSNVYSQKDLKGPYIYNGIDRMDNDIGYTLDNSISCCKHCNYSKRARTYEEFIDWIKQVHSHLNL